MKNLTAEDEAILQAMKSIVRSIANYYGKYTEVVLQRLDIQNPCIMYIENGEITGRKEGAPVTNLALSKLALKQDISAPYFSQTAQGTPLRSSTTIIRNPQGEAIGLLCINTALNAPFNEVLSHWSPVVQDQNEEMPHLMENFSHTTEDMLTTTIESTHQNILKDETIPTSKKTRMLVAQLFALGIFNFKDATKIVANITHISIHTIYRHLREYHKND